MSDDDEVVSSSKTIERLRAEAKQEAYKEIEDMLRRFPKAVAAEIRKDLEKPLPKFVKVKKRASRKRKFDVSKITLPDEKEAKNAQG